MKNFILLFFIFICSCKSITYQDINPIISPNTHLLPDLNTSIDIYNLESSYSTSIRKNQDAHQLRCFHNKELKINGSNYTGILITIFFTKCSSPKFIPGLCASDGYKTQNSPALSSISFFFTSPFINSIS